MFMALMLIAAVQVLPSLLLLLPLHFASPLHWLQQQPTSTAAN
jgi:hypothetical protein